MRSVPTQTSYDLLVIGAPFADSTAAAQSGAAYLYRRDQFGVWFFVVKLEPTDGVLSDEFGSAVAVDGPTVAVGSPLALGGVLLVVALFTNGVLTWLQVKGERDG